MRPRTDAPVHRPDAVDVVCVGLATRDTIVAIPAWPDPDGRMVVERPVTADGGPAATAAVTAARLGARVALVGAVGDDAAGEAVLAGLHDEGVDISAVAIRHGPTPASVVLVERGSGRRSILHAPGVALDGLDERSRALLASASWVHADHVGYPLVVSHASRLSVDAGNPIPALELDGLGLYAPTRSALAARFPDRPLGAMIAAARDAGARRVAVTLGDGGAIAADADGAWSVAPLGVPVVSTLGAGDVFHGAIVASLAAGHGLVEALRRANLAAAMSCLALDGRSAAPTHAALELRLADAPTPTRIDLEETR